MAGAIDWDLAARTGARLAPRGPQVSRERAEAVVADLEEISKAAELPVREVTGLAEGLPIPRAQIVDRGAWVRAAASSMANLAEGDAADEDRKSPLGAKTAGLQAGAVLAFLSSAILGQYDPFTGEDGTLLLVAPNMVMVERMLKVDPADFRLWVCLHEVTHRIQFAAAPWIRDYMREQVAILSAVGTEPLTDVVARLAAELRERRQGTADSDSPGGVIGLLRATQAPPQRDALDRLLALGTLLEGHADHVMDAVGPAVVPSVKEIRAKFDNRRRRRMNPIHRLIRALLGMDAKMQQYVRGKKFVDAVVEEVGMERFNTVWTSPETLPLASEIGHPEAWIKRVLA
ncbi:zinc-dependent metalloprotease [Smaragdicoccus niigatensis]|uniref:zinc-dependent metalloprotease n=1 Tax=Smaragdicoccus niigatensis TaxID=359359 RepID=UPI000476FD0D|nr:zinc-dependent metalloprotease [Smaragdicoccus niigatensis]